MIDDNVLNISLPSIEISTITLVLDIFIIKLDETTWIFVQILHFSQVLFNSHTEQNDSLLPELKSLFTLY